MKNNHNKWWQPIAFIVFSIAVVGMVAGSLVFAFTAMGRRTAGAGGSRTEIYVIDRTASEDGLREAYVDVVAETNAARGGQNNPQGQSYTVWRVTGRDRYAEGENLGAGDFLADVELPDTIGVNLDTAVSAAVSKITATVSAEPAESAEQTVSVPAAPESELYQQTEGVAVTETEVREVRMPKADAAAAGPAPQEDRSETAPAVVVPPAASAEIQEASAETETAGTDETSLEGEQREMSSGIFQEETAAGEDGAGSSFADPVEETIAETAAAGTGEPETAAEIQTVWDTAEQQVAEADAVPETEAAAVPETPAAAVPEMPAVEETAQAAVPEEEVPQETEAPWQAPETQASPSNTQQETVHGDNHDYEEIILTAPNCISPGKARYVCRVCGGYYEVLLPETGIHDWVLVSEDPVTYRCSVCGAEYSE